MAFRLAPCCEIAPTGATVKADELSHIKRLALLAMFSGEPLLSDLVLKGGNVIDLVYDIASRSSADLDFSIERDFPHDNLEAVRQAVERALESTFSAEGYHITDVRLQELPPEVSPDLRHFWGGYRIEFKVLQESVYQTFHGQPQELSRRALECGPHGRSTFSIDISKSEFCRGRIARELGGQTIYVYTPGMLVMEKLRAICQQMPEYLAIVHKTTSTARARDFFDIVAIMKHIRLDVTSAESLELARNIFKAKAVPLFLIGRIPEYRDFHRLDFPSVQSTVKPGATLKDFDYYFDFVVANCVAPLKTLWEV
jgi:hypothetical protein